MRLKNGHDNLNEGARTRLALDGEPTAKEPHSLSNALHTEVPLPYRFLVEPDPPVPNFQSNVLSFLSHADRHLLALAVLTCICQRLLDNSVKGILQDRRQSAELHAAMVFDLR